MVSKVISKIISMQPSFTMSENAISQYVIHHAEQILTTTISTLAEDTGTSEASINRFCKKLGYKGFNGLKIALAQENFYNNMVQENLPNSSNFIASITSDYRNMINSTAALLEEETVFAAVEAMRLAKNINIFGMPNTSFIAREFRFKLEMLGIRAKEFTDPLNIALQANSISEGDLSIFISRSIMIKDIYQAATISIERGGKNLTITSIDSQKLNNISNFKFIISDKLVADNYLSLSNNMTYLYVTDVLYGALLKSDKALQRKKMSNDAILNSIQTIDSRELEY
ncbi:MAG: MurR/RpiR family transcriptional regulator [Eubacteriales bacterium]|nr:MurR/RpiR family transcriptional regulator [Eubacteriales bacterium]